MTGPERMLSKSSHHVTKAPMPASMGNSRSIAGTYEACCGVCTGVAVGRAVLSAYCCCMNVILLCENNLQDVRRDNDQPKSLRRCKRYYHGARRRAISLAVWCGPDGLGCSLLQVADETP